MLADDGNLQYWGESRGEDRISNAQFPHHIGVRPEEIPTRKIYRRVLRNIAVSCRKTPLCRIRRRTIKTVTGSLKIAAPGRRISSRTEARTALVERRGWTEGRGGAGTNEGRKTDPGNLQGGDEKAIRCTTPPPREIRLPVARAPDLPGWVAR
jgi:hypothetical protein